MKVEKRAEGDVESFVVEGYAAVFNEVAEIVPWMHEEILTGAFDDVLNDDVRCLFNHDPNYILARSGGATPTLSFGVDAKGLWYRYESPDRQYAHDLMDAINEGDVSQSSFAFIAKETNWVEREGEADLRQIVKVGKLYDVSPVTYPAYSDTTVAKRSHNVFIEERKEKGISLTEATLIINQNL
ncbi:MAG: hypothetical protein BM557_09575 [Flavobacterium sp. MedPE-SWcel]|nr:MAG: hypothetical protein BM557_09575 [Flavobacterium sp. MedPE-SWcel]